jgi:hypothetical protein
VSWREFARRRDGMIHAMDGGLWLHRHVWRGTPMAHLVSTDRAALLAYGDAHGLPAARLQYKPLKDPRTRQAPRGVALGPRGAVPPRPRHSPGVTPARGGSDPAARVAVVGPPAEAGVTPRAA